MLPMKRQKKAAAAVAVSLEVHQPSDGAVMMIPENLIVCSK
jgi:hypothetical protein